ncbi:hypothetical protein AB0383_32960 [Amycolatopsis sp. NPDC051373]|uniref:hypothetical protein n=1 Tax=Amycolatopsis sp. NPDC051373 TaxID=3155801 RepID=UPI00344BF5E6
MITVWALVGLSCAPAYAVSAPRLLINQDFPDPDVVKTGTGYFAFSTSTGSVNILPWRRPLPPRARGG